MRQVRGMQTRLLSGHTLSMNFEWTTTATACQEPHNSCTPRSWIQIKGGAPLPIKSERRCSGERPAKAYVTCFLRTSCLSVRCGNKNRRSFSQCVIPIVCTMAKKRSVYSLLSCLTRIRSSGGTGNTNALHRQLTAKNKPSLADNALSSSCSLLIFLPARHLSGVSDTGIISAPCSYITL